MRVVLTVIVSACFLNSLSCHAEENKAAQQELCSLRERLVDLYLTLARNDAKNSNHTAALNWYLNAMTLDPEKRSSLLREYADELSKSSRGSEAIILYKEILSGNLTPEDARLTNLGLAQAYVWVNNHEDALKIYDALLTMNPTDKEARKGKAQVYLDYARYDAGKGDRKQAIEWFRKAIEVDPDQQSGVIKELADQLRYNSQVDEAINLYKVILDGKPGGDYERDVRLSLAQTYASKFQYEDALKQYDILLQQNQYDGLARQGKAKVYLNYASYNARLGNHKEAIAWYIKTMDNDPIIRPEILLKIKEQRAFLPDYENLSTDTQDTLFKNCHVQEEQKVAQPEEQKVAQVEVDVSPDQEEIEELTAKADDNSEVPEPENQVSDAKDAAEKASESGQEFAKTLRVFEANRAFQASVALEPENMNYREQYAWHLQSFFFIPEALEQFYILLPLETDQTIYYEVLGWGNHTLGRLDESAWAFSNIYNIPCCLTTGNQFILANIYYRRALFSKIGELKRSLHCADVIEALNIKKKIFDSYVYLGELEKATVLAMDILQEYPDEYLVHYRYASLLYQKKKFWWAAHQFKLLIEKLPCNAFLYLSLGKVLEDMGCCSSALVAYQTAIDLDRNAWTERAYARILAKTGDCCDAINLTNQIDCDSSFLTKALSFAEVSLNCGDDCEAAATYRDILCQYPYNQEALWGLLKSSTKTRNSDDARLSYTRWPEVYFDYPVQNLLANYYRPPEINVPFEIFQDSSHFRRISQGLGFSHYLDYNIRLFEEVYYTQFTQRHFDAINRGSLYVGFDKLFNQNWEFRARVVENFYDRLQHQTSEKLYSKAVCNYHLHVINHPIPELTVDVGYDYYDVIDTVPPFNNPSYNYSNQIGAAALNIRTSDWDAFMYYSKDRFWCLGNLVYGHYSDGNTRETRSFRLGTRFCDLPFSNFYYSYFYLNFKHRAPIFTQNGISTSAYYDPKNFEIHAIGADSKYDITKCLQVGGEVSLLYITKCNNFAYSSYGYFIYKFTDRWICRLDLRYFYQNQSVERYGITGSYHDETANFQINYEF